MKRNLEFNLRQGIFDCLIPTLVLVPTKANHIAGEQRLLEGLLGGLRVRDDWLEPGGMNPCRTCPCPKVFLDVLGGSWGGDETEAWQGVSARTRA